MLTHARKELSLDTQGGGSLDASRLTLRPAAPLDLVDAGTQVDLSADTIAYDSDDDMMKRKISALRSRKGHPIYSREDIREQYCITRKEIAVLDDKGATTRSLFGCLAAQGAAGGGSGSPCNAALFSCVQRASSDENIPPPPPPPTTQQGKDDDDDFASSGFRRRPKPFCLQDPKLRFSNLDAADSDSVRIVVHSRSFSARPRLQSCNSYGSTSQGSLASSSNLSYASRSASRPSNLSFQYERVTLGQCHSVDALNDASTWRRRSDGGVAVPDALLDDRRPKHVSFDSNALVRSNTVAGGLEDVELSLGGPAATSTPLGRRAVSTPDGSQERLLDARHYQDSFERASFGRRRALVKTQATQTETVCRTKASLPAYLTLSPRAARGAKHKAARRRKAKDARRAGTSVSDDSDEDVMEVDLVSKQQRLLPSPKPHKHGKAKQDSLMANKYEDGDFQSKSPRTKGHMEELSRALCNIDLLREARSSARPAPVGHEDAMLNSRRDSNYHSGPRVEQQSNAKQYPSKESHRREEKRTTHPAQPEGLTSPESESSSSQFTERESSRSERSTSSSGPAVAAKLREANADAGRQDTTSESTSEYVTATEHSAKVRESTETSSTSQARRDGTDTSFETASSASLFSSPSSRNGARTKTPSPKASSRDLTRDPDEAAMSSEETEKGHNDSSDESTKKEEQLLSSESGEYSLGRAEGVDDEDEDRTDKSDDEEGALERDADSRPASQADEFSESAAPPRQSPDLMRTAFFDQEGPCSSRHDEEDTDDMEPIMMPLMTFRDVQNAISRSEIRQYDELSTVSEVSEENSNSDQQITERYQPPVPDVISKPETPPLPVPPPPTEERQPSEGRSALEQRPPSEGRPPPPLEEPAPAEQTDSHEWPAATERLTPQSPDQPKEPFHYSSSEYLDSEVATPSFDSATTSCSFNLDLPSSAAGELSLDTTSHASNVSTTTTDSDSKSVVVAESELVRNDDTDVTDSSTSTQTTTRRRPPEAPRQQPDGGGAIPKLQGVVGSVGSSSVGHRRRRERASRVRWEVLEAACSAQVATSVEDLWMRHRELQGRRSRSLPRSPESRTRDSVVCSQCGDKVREHRVPGPYSWERPLSRGLCLDGRRSAPCPDYGHVRMPAPYPTADFYDDDEDDEDAGIHSKSYRQTNWLYINSEHEMLAWRQHLRGNSRRTRKESSSSSVLSDSSPSSSSSSSPTQSRSSSPESTESEREFQRQYVTLTHRMIHRKASLEMYRRIAHRCFEATKTVRIEKSNGEFGFRIHGSHPVVVSAIEKGTPAQSCGLEVGDIIMSINGISVLEANHSEVVRIAHAGTEVLVMELARTCHVLTPKVKEHPPIMWGYLQRLSSGGRSKRWCRRWFVLKPDNRLYWYKNEHAYDMVGAVMLEAVSVSRVVEAGAEHAFKVVKSPGTTSNSNAIYFAADDEEAAGRWISALNQVACIASRGTSYMDTVVSNMHSPCGSLPDPDCQGYLCKLSQQWKSWKKRFLVLKDACLYFYKDRNAPVAVGAFLLHGYRVQSCSMTGKKNTFEAIPPEPLMRHLRFLADTEYEKKRWLASMEYSIDRWIKV